jgi:tRNA dimethylallyltransferase
MRRTAVLLMGPTGSGKSALALELAERLPLEIVSVDSALVYRGMDIGTAKPAAAVRERIPHHLIDIRDPKAAYSAGEFVRDAQLAMEDIWSRGRQPLLVGGTMLYFHALTEGLASLPRADASVRARIETKAACDGWPALHRELAAVDPAAATRIHVNDPQRIQRALEVFHVTGEPITRLQGDRRAALAGVQVIELALAPSERRCLNARIEARFQRMLEAGLLAEVQFFYQRGDLTGEHPAMRAVGYRQLWQYLTGRHTLDEATTRAIIATRQLAKRQLTWLRRRAGAKWFDSEQPEVAQRIFEALAAGEFAEWSQV